MNQFSQFVVHHWPLWVAFAILLVLIIINELFALQKKAKEVSPQMAVSLINNDGAVVVDLRDKEAFKNGHIIESIQASADDFNQAKMNKYKDTPLILVCARGLQAPVVAAKIRPLGFNPVVVRGGMSAWINANLPLIKK